MELIVHDLKNDRPNTSGGLPGIYKLVPIAFYATLLLGVLLSLYFFLSLKAYKASEIIWSQRLTEAKAEQTSIMNQQTEIVDLAQRAEGIGRWLEGCRPLQPVTVAIARSMAKESTISELSLNRNPEIPAHTFMKLKINGGGSEQIETTLTSINALNFQTYSAQQVKAKKATDFQATLIYSDR